MADQRARSSSRTLTVGEILDLTLPHQFTVGVRLTFTKPAGAVTVRFAHAQKTFETHFDSGKFQSLLIPAVARLESVSVSADGKDLSADSYKTETVKLQEEYFAETEIVFGVDNDMEEVETRDYRNLSESREIPENLEEIVAESKRNRSSSNVAFIAPPEQLDLPAALPSAKASPQVAEQLRTLAGKEQQQGKQEDILVEVSTKDQQKYQRVLEILAQQQGPVEVTFTVSPALDLAKRRSVANGFRAYHEADANGQNVKTESFFSAEGAPMPLVLVYDYTNLRALQHFITKVKTPAGEGALVKNLAPESWLGAFVISLDPHHTVMIQAYY